jgi:hypothetical protein
MKNKFKRKKRLQKGLKSQVLLNRWYVGALMSLSIRMALDANGIGWYRFNHSFPTPSGENPWLFGDSVKNLAVKIDSGDPIMSYCVMN